MLDLVFSVLFTGLIFVIFKLFGVYKVQTFYAIITNYVVACIVGLLLNDGNVKLTEIPNKQWFLGTLALGLLFIIVFNLMAATAQKVGVSVASVATKMSFVIPVIFGVFLYKEVIDLYKIIGILLAISAVYFASAKETKSEIKKFSYLLPILVFLGSGFIDVALKYFQEKKVSQSEFSLFSAVVFGSAATIGLIIILVQSSKKPLKINLKNILGGIALGVPNFFSIFFLLKALNNKNLTSVSIFTINNVAIVMFSTFLGILLFKERMSVKNWGGIILAVASILIVALS